MPDKLVERYRRRIEYEDQIYGQRTGFFLMANSILLVAFNAARGMKLDPDLVVSALDLVVSALGLVVSLVWSLSSWQSAQIIKALTKQHLALVRDKKDRVEEVVRENTFHRYRISPTTLVAILPIVFILAWSTILAWGIFMQMQ